MKRNKRVTRIKGVRKRRRRMICMKHNFLSFNPKEWFIWV